MTGAGPGWQASLRLGFVARAGLHGGDDHRTVLAERRHHGPLVVQKPLYPEGGVCHAVLIHPPAGIAGGDTLDIDVEVGSNGHAVLTTPGATKWYKSLGRQALQQVRLTLAAGARLDWLPQENIVFDQARARLDTTVTMAPGASAIGWDAVVLGRQASGEQWSDGVVSMGTRIGGAGRILWLEQAELAADSPLRRVQPGLDGLPVFGTLWAVGGGASQSLAEAIAAGLPCTGTLRAGITCLEDAQQPMLLLRVLGAHIEPVRRLLIETWTALREPIHGVAARPLRLWST